jgi:hypothetical protein
MGVGVGSGEPPPELSLEPPAGAAATLPAGAASRTPRVWAGVGQRVPGTAPPRAAEDDAANPRAAAAAAAPRVPPASPEDQAISGWKVASRPPVRSPNEVSYVSHARSFVCPFRTKLRA